MKARGRIAMGKSKVMREEQHQQDNSTPIDETTSDNLRAPVDPVDCSLQKWKKTGKTIRAAPAINSVLSVLGIVLVFCGAVLWSQNWLDCEGGKRSLGFSQTVGKVVRVHRYSGHKGDRNYVTYEYTVDGKTLSSRRTRFPDYMSDVEFYGLPVGKEVKVYLDPKNPSNACLFRGLEKAKSDYEGALGAITFVLGTGLLFLALIRVLGGLR